MADDLTDDFGPVTDDAEILKLRLQRIANYSSDIAKALQAKTNGPVLVKFQDGTQETLYDIVEGKPGQFDKLIAEKKSQILDEANKL